jgi:hypothetical protein
MDMAHFSTLTDANVRKPEINEREDDVGNQRDKFCLDAAALFSRRPPTYPCFYWRNKKTEERKSFRSIIDALLPAGPIRSPHSRPDLHPQCAP